MCPNSQETEDLVTFTEKSLIENFIFLSSVLDTFHTSCLSAFKYKPAYMYRNLQK